MVLALFAFSVAVSALGIYTGPIFSWRTIWKSLDEDDKLVPALTLHGIVTGIALSAAVISGSLLLGE